MTFNYYFFFKKKKEPAKFLLYVVGGEMATTLSPSGKHLFHIFKEARTVFG